jgi:amino acid adenylation domain-containing protein
LHTSSFPVETVPELVRRRVAAAPDTVAVICEDRILTYAEMDAAAGRLAAVLLDHGLEPGLPVAVLLDRTPDLLVAVFAVWKAGGVYLPVDPSLPAERVELLARDAGARIAVSRAGAFGHRLSEVKAVVDVDADVDAPGGSGPCDRPAPRGDEPAYVIHTSGSTGVPKGVVVSHRSLANVVGHLVRAMEVGPGDAWLAMAGIGFDIAMAELTVPLAAGARLVLPAPVQTRDPRALIRLIRDAGVTRMQAVPSQWEPLLAAGFDAPGMVAMVGGEPLTVNLARALRARVGRLFNGYGPTETTVVSTMWEVPAGADRVSLGEPIANTRLHLLGDDLMPVAPGEAGELCIAGAGVALGYLERPELTARCFVPEPGGASGALMYRTGDRCRLLADGTLEFLGRGDGQVKIRGHRVELGEVEARLGAMPGLAGAVAVVEGLDGDAAELVAYVAPTGDGEILPSAVREFVAAALPSAMVPSRVRVLEEFPLTANGKVDRAALADAAPADAAVLAVVPPSQDPVVPLLTEVCDICREVLAVPQVSPGDDLGDLGGHSLSMMQIAGVMTERWGVEIPVQVFFDYDTVGEIAEAIGRIRAAADV